MKFKPPAFRILNMNIPFIDEFIDTQISYISVTMKIFAELELDPNNSVSAFTIILNALQ